LRILRTTTDLSTSSRPGEKRERVRAKRGPMTGFARLARVFAPIPATHR
jgi:hypothetical protein